MLNYHFVKHCRDTLLEAVSEKKCRPCKDERKKQFKLDYNNPLNCECRCESVDKILSRARNLHEDIERQL